MVEAGCFGGCHFLQEAGDGLEEMLRVDMLAFERHIAENNIGMLARLGGHQVDAVSFGERAYLVVGEGRFSVDAPAGSVLIDLQGFDQRLVEGDVFGDCILKGFEEEF